MIPERQPTHRATVPLAENILHGYFPVLDHGFVSLVDYMGNDEAIEAAARVSYGHGTRHVSKTRGLIRYLLRHRHTTPFEMVEFKFHCAMPIFVARQWIRHRTASVNEYSARYSILPMLFYMPEPEQLAPQSKDNKQGRESEPLDPKIHSNIVGRFVMHRSTAISDYRWMTHRNVARELARIDLPLSTYTEWYWKIDLHNLLHFLTLRVDPHAQWEIRQFANVIAGMVQRVAPLAFEAWVDYHLMAERFSYGEMEILAQVVSTREDEEMVTGTGHGLWDRHLEAEGLSPREIREFKAKFRLRERPTFDLDMEAMLAPEEMHSKRMRSAGEPVVKEAK